MRQTRVILFVETSDIIRRNLIQLLHARFLICLFQYSDRFTPVLLIVSLAGIKVCSPDGKVSTIEMHTQLLLRKRIPRVCARTLLWRNRLAVVPAASSKTELHPLELRVRKSSSLLFCGEHDYIPLRRVTF